MYKKILITGVVFSTLLALTPALAQNSTSTEDKFREAQKRLEDRYLEAKKKLEEKLTAYQIKKANQAIALTCVARAVNIREATIGSAFSTYASAQASALQNRANALNAAWSSTTTPSVVRDAVNLAWKNYRQVHQVAVAAHNSSTRAAWNTYKLSAKTCKATNVGVSVEARGSGVDEAR